MTIKLSNSFINVSYFCYNIQNLRNRSTQWRLLLGSPLSPLLQIFIQIIFPLGGSIFYSGTDMLMTFLCISKEPLNNFEIAVYERTNRRSTVTIDLIKKNLAAVFIIYYTSCIYLKIPLVYLAVLPILIYDSLQGSHKP